LFVSESELRVFLETAISSPFLEGDGGQGYVGVNALACPASASLFRPVGEYRNSNYGDYSK
jgi:hypothetical protein